MAGKTANVHLVDNLILGGISKDGHLPSQRIIESNTGAMVVNIIPVRCFCPNIPTTDDWRRDLEDIAVSNQSLLGIERSVR